MTDEEEKLTNANTICLASLNKINEILPALVTQCQALLGPFLRELEGAVAPESKEIVKPYLETMVILGVLKGVIETEMSNCIVKIEPYFPDDPPLSASN